MIEITAGNAERRVAELRFHFGQRRSLADELHCVRMPQTVEVGALTDARAPRQALTLTEVPVFAGGPGSELFDAPNFDNTDVGRLLFDAVSGN